MENRAGGRERANTGHNWEETTGKILSADTSLISPDLALIMLIKAESGISSATRQKWRSWEKLPKDEGTQRV